jgi:hypothetical protein
MVVNAPVLAEVDLLIVGGTSAGVQAALAARMKGATVYCATPYTYLGEDVCAFMRYWPSIDPAEGTELTHKLFPGREVPTPMSIKYSLEQALLESGSGFVFGAFPVCLLRDDTGRVAGLIVATRSGFHAILAGAIIDTTDRGLVGRMTTARFRDHDVSTGSFRRVVVGGTVPEGGLIDSVKEMGRPVVIDGREYKAHEITLTMELTDSSPWSFCRAEALARSITWNDKQMIASDRLFYLPVDTFVSAVGTCVSTEHERFDTGTLFCEEGVLLLSACADIAPGIAEQFVEPAVAMRIGEQIGSDLGGRAGTSGVGLQNIRAVYSSSAHVSGADICRKDVYFRMASQSGVSVDLNRLSDFGRVDVLVAGGGTAGAPAGISAGRAGARTLITEYLPGLGGVGTEGRICTYYYGNRVGFTTEIDTGTLEIGADPEFSIEDGKWNPEWKKQWYLNALVDARVDVWFGSLVCAAALDGDRVCGAAVVSHYGCGIVGAGCVVDASGNADVAAAAGAETVTISKTHVAVQGTGLGPLTPGIHYQNTDHTFVDDSDLLDVTRGFVMSRAKFRDEFDLIQLVDSRQRQQVIGDITLDPVDFLAKRTFPDTVCVARSNFDSHGFTIHPLFVAKAPDKEAHFADIPLRALLPRGIDNVLVTGLGVSAHRDALPVIRMQPDVQNQGYAAGRAAAICALKGFGPRDLDIRSLQRHLVEVGILSDEAVDQEDSFPLPDNAVKQAVAEGIDSYLGLAIVFAEAGRSLPLLRSSYVEETDSDSRLQRALVLGLMGDASGVETLIGYLDSHEWDEGWTFTGMGQFGFSLSRVDSVLVAAACTGDAAVLPAMMTKLNNLGNGREFSHYRALTMAFERLPSVEAAPIFAAFLDDPETGTSAFERVADAVDRVNNDPVDTSERNRELKELLLARGLYACGDYQNKARSILERYSNDLHGHYARHARAILQEGR